MNDPQKDSASKDSVSKADYEKLQTQLTQVTNQFSEIKSKLGDLDIDTVVSRAREAEELKKKAAESDPKKIDELLKEKEDEVSSRFTRQLEEARTEARTKAQELKTERVIKTVNGQAAEVFNPDALPLIESIIEKNCDWEDGQVVIRNSDGKIEYSKKDPSKKMSVKEFLDELSAKHPSLAKSNMKSGVKDGAGASNGNPVGDTGISVQKYLSMTEAERKALPRDINEKLARAVFYKKK